MHAKEYEICGRTGGLCTQCVRGHCRNRVISHTPPGRPMNSAVVRHRHPKPAVVDDKTLAWYSSQVYQHRANVSYVWQKLLRPIIANRAHKCCICHEEDLYMIDANISKHDETLLDENIMATMAESLMLAAQGRPLHIPLPEKFSAAWRYHYAAETHHWQHWVNLYDGLGLHNIYADEMPLSAVVQMVCDWHAWGMEGKRDKTAHQYFYNHKRDMILHPKTYEVISELVEYMKVPFTPGVTGNGYPTPPMLEDPPFVMPVPGQGEEADDGDPTPPMLDNPPFIMQVPDQSEDDKSDEGDPIPPLPDGDTSMTPPPEDDEDEPAGSPQTPLPGVGFPITPGGQV